MQEEKEQQQISNMEQEEEQDIYDEDLFKGAINLEGNLYQAGFNFGIQEQEKGAIYSNEDYNYKDGFIVGQHIGKEIGQYVGFIESVQLIKEKLDIYQKHKSQIDKRIQSINDIIMNLDLHDLDECSEQLLLLRSKFSALVSSLGLKKQSIQQQQQQSQQLNF